jgi:1,4-dihydroxy-2-naphthoate octaprenyltransferase
VRLVYRILAMLIAAGVVVQAAAIAFALFDIEKKTDDGQIYSKDSHNGGVVLHSVLGEMVIPVIALLLLIVSFFAAIPGGVKWAAITFGVLVLQVVLAYAGDALPAIGVLHGINAFALAGVASIAMRKARLAESPAPAVAA